MCAKTKNREFVILFYFLSNFETAYLLTENISNASYKTRHISGKQNHKIYFTLIVLAMSIDQTRKRQLSSKESAVKGNEAIKKHRDCTTSKHKQAEHKKKEVIQNWKLQKASP